MQLHQTAPSILPSAHTLAAMREGRSLSTTHPEANPRRKAAHDVSPLCLNHEAPSAAASAAAKVLAVAPPRRYAPPCTSLRPAPHQSIQAADPLPRLPADHRGETQPCGAAQYGRLASSRRLPVDSLRCTPSTSQPSWAEAAAIPNGPLPVPPLGAGPTHHAAPRCSLTSLHLRGPVGALLPR